MRTIVVIGWILLGFVVVSLVAAAASNGRDHTGDTVRTQQWAQDVCGTVGAYEGDLHAIRDEISRDNYGARQNDGGSGDSVEEIIFVRTAVDRAIFATTHTLQEGLKRAGIPDAPHGAAASAILRDWGQRTETNLRVAKAVLKQKPSSPTNALARLETPVKALVSSVIDGRASFAKVAALDPALRDALNGSRNCRKLVEEQP